MTNFVGSQQRIRALRLVNTTYPSFRLLTLFFLENLCGAQRSLLELLSFSWTVTLGKILTLDRLWNKGVTIMDWCYICKRRGESVNHLLLHCPFAFKLWSMVWVLFGVIWVMPQSVANIFASWQGPFGRHRNIDL